MKLLIAGSRDLHPGVYEIDKAFDDFNQSLKPEMVVSGTARGVDRCGELWAKWHRIHVERFPADWDTYGKKAGYLRNAEMAEFATHGIIFWDGQSRGTRHMINLLKSAGKTTVIVRS